MRLLTYFGTILRLEGSDPTPVHAALWPERPSPAGSRDLTLGLPPPPLTDALRRPDTNPVEWLEPARGGRWLTWRAGNLFRCADQHAGRVLPTRPKPAEWEHFLPITEAQVAALRAVLSHSWLEGGERITPTLQPGPVLHIGDARLPLEAVTVKETAEGLRLATPEEAIMLTVPIALPVPEVEELTSAPGSLTPVPSAQAFLAASEPSVFAIGGAPEIALLPLTVDRADRDWLLTARTEPLTEGPHEPALRVVHARDAVVLTARGLEGLVLRDRVALTEAGYLTTYQPVGEGPIIARAAERFYLRRDIAAAAPLLPGPAVVFTTPHCNNYFHFLIEGLVPLLAMRDLLPPGAGLLVPDTFAAMRGQVGVVDHEAALAAWGFDTLPRLAAPPPAVRVTELIAAEGPRARDIPASLLRQARARLTDRHPPAATGRRLYIPRRGTRGIDNEAELAPVLAEHGFETVTLDGLSPAGQVALFAAAGFVLAPHGAAITNALFCAEGTRVLEIMPDVEYRPMYAELNHKLDLVHAVLPAPTRDGGFNGPMRVDPARLARLIRLLDASAP